MKLALVLASGYTANAAAEVSGINIPPPASSYNYDEIRTSGGSHCRQALGSNVTSEVGMVANDNGDAVDSGAIYGRIVYHFGTPKRIDCSKMYNLEIEMLRQEVEMLRRQNQYMMPD